MHRFRHTHCVIAISDVIFSGGHVLVAFCKYTEDSATKYLAWMLTAVSGKFEGIIAYDDHLREVLKAVCDTVLVVGAVCL